jgi:hypothetical protein
MHEGRSLAAAAPTMAARPRVPQMGPVVPTATVQPMPEPNQRNTTLQDPVTCAGRRPTAHTCRSPPASP